jgi:hypothetical protein
VILEGYLAHIGCDSSKFDIVGFGSLPSKLKVRPIEVEAGNLEPVPRERHAMPALATAQVKQARANFQFQGLLGEGNLLFSPLGAKQMAVNVKVVVPKKLYVPCRILWYQKGAPLPMMPYGGVVPIMGCRLPWPLATRHLGRKAVFGKAGTV